MSADGFLRDLSPSPYQETNKGGPVLSWRQIQLTWQIQFGLCSTRFVTVSAQDRRQLTKKSRFEPEIDLLEIRRQLVALRSNYSDNRKITKLLNRLLSKLFYLREPADGAHERFLIQQVKTTLAKMSPLLPPE